MSVIDSIIKYLFLSENSEIECPSVLSSQIEINRNQLNINQEQININAKQIQINAAIEKRLRLLEKAK